MPDEIGMVGLSEPNFEGGKTRRNARQASQKAH